MATLLGAWFDRVSARTGWPGVNILWLDGIASLICSFYLMGAECPIVWADLSVRYTGLSEQIYLWNVLGCLSRPVSEMYLVVWANLSRNILGCLRRSVCEISKVVWAYLSMRYTGLAEQIRSVWNNTRLSEQICLWDILGCLSRSVCEIYLVVWADLSEIILGCLRRSVCEIS